MPSRSPIHPVISRGLPRARAGLVLAAALLASATARAQPGPPPAPQAAPRGPRPAEDDPSGGQSALVRKADEPAPPAPPPPAQVTPPVLRSDPGATYPAQAIADGVRDPVTVTLVLVVAVDGTVSDARIEAPVGHGFDEAALEAARRIVFDPATRGGKAVAAKIKHSYAFSPPAARFVGRIAKATGDASIAGAVVRLESTSGQVTEVKTDASGRFQVPPLAAGTYRVTVDAPGYTPAVSDESIGPGEEISLTVRLKSARILAPPPQAGDDGVEEITIRGVRPPREVTKRTLEQRELNRIPGTSGDALRALQNLPGIARPPGLAGLLIVRGAAPNQTQIYADGTQIPIAYHFGGLSSVVPTEALDKIDFYPGNFSTYYGRVLGGIVDIGLRSPRADKGKRLHAVAQVDLIDARMLAEGGVCEAFSSPRKSCADDGWAFLLGGRRSHVDSWLGPVLSGLGSAVTTAPVYYDYQAVLERKWDKKRQAFRLAVFGSDDRFAILTNSVVASNPGIGGNFSLGTAFYRVQARYTNKVSDDTELRFVAAVGKDALQFTVGNNFFFLDTYPISGRAEVSQKIASGVRNNVGIDVLYTPYDIGVRLPPPPQPGEPPAGPFGATEPLVVYEKGSTYTPAFYDEVELTPWKGGRIVPGVRVDFTKATQSWDLAPRTTVRQDVHQGFPRTTIKGGIGRFMQPPQPQETNAVFGVPGLRSNRATHYAVGVEQELTRQIETSVEGFYRQQSDLVTQRIGNVGTGAAFGVETLVRYKPDARFFGFLAYTLSRSVLRDTPSSPLRLFQYDQTHILTALGSYRLGRGWELGARYRLISGSMSTRQNYGFYDLNVSAYIPAQGYPPFSERNPLFHQLDVRVDKTWSFGQAGKIGVYLDALNVYNAANSEGTDYNYNSTLRSRGSSLPFIPNVGFRVEN